MLDIGYRRSKERRRVGWPDIRSKEDERAMNSWVSLHLNNYLWYVVFKGPKDMRLEKAAGEEDAGRNALRRNIVGAR